MRAFIALALPNAALHQITTVQRLLVQQLRAQQLDHSIRWTRADNLHLTLRFLGEIDDVQQLSLEQKLTKLAQQHAPLALFVDGMGCFPSAQRPSVIWCGIQGDLMALARLQAEIDRAVSAIGLPAEDKPFKPHLTIGRVQRNANASLRHAVGAVVMQVGTAPQRSAPVTVMTSELILMQSALTPSGATYTPLGVFLLAGPTPSRDQRPIF
ncbi:MAG: RNA 2',3'-cyclic phosphodiesterase [Caldilineaceae bacterium]|jgi:2'-5' RNA ligase|nr:RNA 2',3'-cyclic phosphodiesterase [Caldilineaceae bacterium]